MKFLAGVALGVCFVLAVGAATEHYLVTVQGEFEKVGVFQSSFSGVSNDGYCYMAITNTRTGRTEIFGMSKDTHKKFSDNPFQMAREGSVIVEPQDAFKRP
jgi:hypothetical protein